MPFSSTRLNFSSTRLHLNDDLPGVACAGVLHGAQQFVLSHPMQLIAGVHRPLDLSINGGLKFGGRILAAGTKCGFQIDEAIKP